MTKATRNTGNKKQQEQYHRLVVKLGTSLITAGSDQLNLDIMASIVGQVARLHQQGFEIIIVSSGAIAAGRQKLALTKQDKDIPFKLAISRGTFPSKRIRVARRFTSFTSADIRRIKNEKEFLSRIYSIFTPNWLGDGRFVMPLRGKITGTFGEKRVFNDNFVSRHRGIDIRSPKGALIRASNSGEVALVRDLYFSGNTVIVNHGLGLFSIYCHMSKVIVGEGDFVNKGEDIGYTGSTGRSTGPHLHWGLRLVDDYADPLSMMELSFD